MTRLGPRIWRPLLLALALFALLWGALAAVRYWSGSEAARPVLHLLPRGETSADSGPFLNASLSGFAFPAQPSTVPNLAFVDGAGQRHSLAEFRGRPIVLNVWATWCVPCRKEMPTLDRLQAQLADTDALVLPLSIDRKGPAIVKAFYHEIGVKSLGIYVDTTNAVSQKLGLIGIPTTLLIDRNGREIARKIGPVAWDSPTIVQMIRTRLAPRSTARPDH